MKNKIQIALMVVFIMICLPYVLTWMISYNDREKFIAQRASGDIITVDTGDGVREIAFEDYTAGVLAMQMDPKSSPEALKAQAVIVRTNLAEGFERQEAYVPGEPYMTVAQMEEKGISEQILAAAESTKDEILCYGDRPIMASFHAISSGSTRNASEALKSDEYPYLVQVDSSQDVRAADYLKRVELTPAQIVEKCRTEYPQLSVAQSGDSAERLQIKILSRDSSDYVLSIQVGDTVMPGEQFRKLLDLPSSCFTMEAGNGAVAIITKGLGHGLGMSQNGAEQMAEGGSTYSEILAAYFPGTVLVKKTEQF